MSFQQLFAVLCLCLCVSANVWAQADKTAPKTLPAPAGATKPAPTTDQRAVMQEKMKAAAMQKGGATMDPGAGNPRMAAMNSVSDITLQRGEKKLTINGYKLDFASNPTVDPEQARATITLYTGKDEKIGKINFYAETAKALKEKKALDERDMANLSYDMDMLSSIQNFLSTSMRSVLVINADTKQAYISSDVVPTRNR